LKAGAELTITAEVQNAGDRAGDEVAQLYLSNVSASVPVPIRSLAGMQRLSLKPGERKQVTFKLSPNQMSVITDDGKRTIQPGEFRISVGGGQPGIAAQSGGVVTGRFVIMGKAIELR
jgi:beta-glucosidase